MNMKKIAAGVGAALTLGYGASAFAAIASPGAVADAYLRLSNFTLLAGNNAAGKSLTPLPIVTSDAGVRLDSVVTNADTSASLGGAPASQSTSVGLGVPFSIQNTVGGAGYVANTILPAGVLNPNTYAGSSTSSFGNALVPIAQPGSSCGAGNIGDCVPVHNQVNLTSAGSVGSATANQNLITQFTLTTSTTQRFELSFDAEGFLRAALGQPGISANASFGWTATVRAVGSNVDILKWTPNGFTFGVAPLFIDPDDLTSVGGVNGPLPPFLFAQNGLSISEGTCVAAGTCREYSDAFSMSNNVGLLDVGDVALANALGAFEAELTLGAGSYTFTINHNTNADAQVIPEPGTLALLGAGLMGLGVRRRKVA